MRFQGIKPNPLFHKRPENRSPSPPRPQGEMPLLIYFMAALRSGAPHFIRDRKEEFSYFDLDPE
jgi:hypothetical protein